MFLNKTFIKRSRINIKTFYSESSLLQSKVKLMSCLICLKVRKWYFNYSSFIKTNISFYKCLIPIIMSEHNQYICEVENYYPHVRVWGTETQKEQGENFISLLRCLGDILASKGVNRLCFCAPIRHKGQATRCPWPLLGNKRIKFMAMPQMIWICAAILQHVDQFKVGERGQPRAAQSL